MYSEKVEKMFQKNTIEIVKMKYHTDDRFVNRRAWKSETNLNREKSKSDWYIQGFLNHSDIDDDRDDDDDNDSSDGSVSLDIFCLFHSQIRYIIDFLELFLTFSGRKSRHFCCRWLKKIYYCLLSNYTCLCWVNGTNPQLFHLGVIISSKILKDFDENKQW